MTRWMLVMTLALGAITACDDKGTEKPATPAPETELTADQVVARNLAAIGGVDRLKAMKTLTLRGEYQEGSEVDTWTAYRARPNKFRKEGTHKGKAFTKLFDGARGYKAEGGEALAAVPEDMQAKMKMWSDFDDPLVDYATRGHQVKLAGVEDVKGSKAYHLELTLASGDVEHRFYDASTFLQVKHQATYKDKDGKEKTKVSFPGDWREVNGVKFAFASEGEVDGVQTKVTVKEIVVDAPIDASKFTAPAVGQVAVAH